MGQLVEAVKAHALLTTETVEIVNSVLVSEQDVLYRYRIVLYLLLADHICLCPSCLTKRFFLWHLSSSYLTRIITLLSVLTLLVVLHEQI